MRLQCTIYLQSALVCSLIDCGTAATIKFNGRQIDPDTLDSDADADSDFDFNSGSNSNSDSDSGTDSDPSKQQLTKNNSAIEYLKATGFR